MVAGGRGREENMEGAGLISSGEGEDRGCGARFKDLLVEVSLKFGFFDRGGGSDSHGAGVGGAVPVVVLGSGVRVKVRGSRAREGVVVQGVGGERGRGAGAPTAVKRSGLITETRREGRSGLEGLFGRGRALSGSGDRRRVGSEC